MIFAHTNAGNEALVHALFCGGCAFPFHSQAMPVCQDAFLYVSHHGGLHASSQACRWQLGGNPFWKCLAFSQVIPFFTFLLLCGKHPFTQDSMTVQCPSSFDYPWIHQPQLVEPSCWPSLGPPCLPIPHAMHLCHLYMHACAYASVFPLLVDSVFPAQCIY